jgi:hypothetical protein
MRPRGHQGRGRAGVPRHLAALPRGAVEERRSGSCGDQAEAGRARSRTRSTRTRTWSSGSTHGATRRRRLPALPPTQHLDEPPPPATTSGRRESKPSSFFNRPRVHFMRNALARRQERPARRIGVHHRIRAGACRRRRGPVAPGADQVRPKLPKLAALLDETEDHVLAHMSFPKAHRAKIHWIQA